MPVSAFLLALAAAFVHALWNLLLARARDPEAAGAVALLAAVVVFAPVAALQWELESEAWPYIAASSLLELVYFALLGAAYRRAEVSVVYPLARGVAPVLVLVVGVLALDAETSAAQAVGVVPRGRRRAARARAAPAGRGVDGVLFGLAIACSIAAYTLVDDEGIRFANAVTYLELVLVARDRVRARSRLAQGPLGAARRAEPATVVAGVGMWVAYGLVLAALARAEAAPVAAVRETSIVIATVGAALFLHERVGPSRLAGAVLVAVGVALLGF